MGCQCGEGGAYVVASLFQECLPTQTLKRLQVGLFGGSHVDVAEELAAELVRTAQVMKSARMPEVMKVFWPFRT